MPLERGRAKPQSNQEEPLYTIREVAKRYRVTVATVRHWVDSGALSAIELPHRGRRKELRFKESDLRTFDPSIGE